MTTVMSTIKKVVVLNNDLSSFGLCWSHSSDLSFTYPLPRNHRLVHVIFSYLPLYTSKCGPPVTSISRYWDIDLQRFTPGLRPLLLIPQN